MFFPSRFKGQNVAFNAAELKRLDALCDVILETEDAEDNLQDAEFDLLKLTKAEFWNSYIKGNADVGLKKDYQLFELSIQEHTNKDLKTITTFEFYNLLDYLELKNNN